MLRQNVVSVWVFFKLQLPMEPRSWQEDGSGFSAGVLRMYLENALCCLYCPPKTQFPLQDRWVLEMRQQGPGPTSQKLVTPVSGILPTALHI